MTTRRTTFTRTPFVITAFLAANLAVTGAPLVAMAEEGVPQENPPAAEQQPEQQAPEQLQTQQAPEPNLETQAVTPIPYEVDTEGKTLTITGDLAAGCWEGQNPEWGSLDKTKVETVNIKESAKPKAYNCENLFVGFTNLTSVNLKGLDVTEVSSFNNMFSGCDKLEELTLPKEFRFKSDSDPKLTDPDKNLDWSNNVEAKKTADLVKYYAPEDDKKAPTADYTWKWQKEVEVTVTTATPENVVYDGEEHKPTPAVSVTVGEEVLPASDYTMSAYAYDPSSPVHAGEVTVTATVSDAHDGKGYLIWSPATATTKFTIEQRPVHVTAKDVTMVYDGYKIDGLAPLKVSMTYATGDIIEADKDKVSLKAGYTCEWKREVGEYEIKVGDVKFEDKDSSSSSSSSTSLATSADDTSVAANYVAGEKTNGKLTVTAADISNATVDSVSDRTYNGDPITPTPAVKMVYTANGNTSSTELKRTTEQKPKDGDYILSYANNTQVGKATITVKGTGNYTGTKTVNFNIKSASSTSGSSTTSSTTSSTSATPSTADPTSVTGIGSLLASGIAALGAARFTRKRKN